MTLFEFAFCPDFNGKIASLAALCPEKWTEDGRQENLILKNYVNHTFVKLEEEGKILCEKNYALFNTGLFTSKYNEPIYAYFVPTTHEGMTPWYFKGFYAQFQLSRMGIEALPPRANYFDNPEVFIFDTNCEIVVQYHHIFGTPSNFLRIPKCVRENPNKIMLFDGAIKRAKCMIEADYKIAIPQYYKGNVQLLVPIYLSNANQPDLALSVSKSQNGNQYLGISCLTLEMAYNNARLIARQDNTWLSPQTHL